MTRASLIVENARIRTLDPTVPTASALAIADGTIVAVGDRHEVAELRGLERRSSISPAPHSCLASSTAICTRSHGAQRTRGVDLTGIGRWTTSSTPFDGARALQR